MSGPLVVLDGLTTTSTRYLIFPRTTLSMNFGRVYKLTRNTFNLTQASKNGRKPYLFPQKKFVSVF